MLRFFHTGDLHPDSHATFAGKLPIDPATGKNKALTDLRLSLEFLLQVVTDPPTRCQAGLLPGDIFDSDKPTMDEVQVIVDFVDRVAREMPLFVIPGNHDKGLSGKLATALEPLKMRPNVHIFERPDSYYLGLEQGSVKLFFLPYPQKGQLLAMEEHKGKSPEEITALTNHLLAGILRGFTLKKSGADHHVLLAHGTTSAAKVGVQPRSLAHDILIPLEECAWFDYVALNHIHARQRVADNAEYSGSLGRQDFGEEHESKGFNLVELCPGKRARVQFVENPHARHYLTIDAAEFERGHVYGEEVVVRVKDTLTLEAYELLKPRLKAAERQWPYFQDAIEVLTASRARDAGMAQCLTIDDALARALEGKAPADELPAILGKHQQLLQEVGA